jgi:AraC-like DNA-binding protein
MDQIYIVPEKTSSPSILTRKEGVNEFNLIILHTGITRHKNTSDVSSRSEHKHSVYHILLYLGEGNLFMFNNEKVRSNRGTFVVCSPGTTHNFQPLLQGESVYAEITFEYTWNEDHLDIYLEDILSTLMFQTIHIPDGLYCLQEGKIHQFLELFHELLALLRDFRSPLFDQHLKMAELFQFISKSHNQSRNSSYAVIIRNRIQSSLPGVLNLDILSQEFNRSKSWIIGEFKNTYKITPMKYYRQVRLSMTSELLKNSSRTTEDIAEQFGFYDTFHFIKSFKKAYNITPGLYRRNFSKNNVLR